MTEKTFEDYLVDPDYRHSVGAVLFKDGKVFIAERSDAKNCWQMPQGGVDEEEDLLDAVRRELFEETALTREQMELKSVYPTYTFYTLPKKFQKKGFKGQVQKWFLFAFKDEDKNIDLKKAQDKEFTQWRWESMDEILKQVESFRRPVYEEIFNRFGGTIQSSETTSSNAT
jgi:putative (di)nucleoside polyphosphate hydrolase